MVTQTQACSIDDSSPSLQHNKDRKTTASEILQPMVSTADFGWFLNYNAVIFPCKNYDMSTSEKLLNTYNSKGCFTIKFV